MKDDHINYLNSLNIVSIECKKCGALNRLKQQNDQHRYRCGFCKKDLINPMRRINYELDRTCRECLKILANEPAILIDGNCYCFFHAKSSYPKMLVALGKQEKVINQNFKELKTEFEKKKSTEEAALQAWHHERSEHASGNFFSKWKWVWYLLIVIILVAINPTLGILGAIPCLLLMPFIDEYFKGQMNLQFDAKFPPPISDSRLSAPEYKYLPKPVLSTHPENHDPESINVGYDRNAILRRDEFKCQNCRKIFQPELLEIHHVEPRAKGGCDSPKNLTTLCLKCHLVEDWFGHIHKMRNSYGLGSGFDQTS